MNLPQLQPDRESTDWMFAAGVPAPVCVSEWAATLGLVAFINGASLVGGGKYDPWS